MRRIDLSRGGWAELRSADEIKSVRLRRILRSASTAAIGAMRKIPDDLPKDADALAEVDMGAIGLTFDEAESLQRLQEVAVVAFLARWSLKDPLPTTATVGDMDDDLFQEIALATQADAAKFLSTPDRNPPDFDPTPEDTPGNPTGRDFDSTPTSSAREEAASSSPLSWHGGPSIGSVA